MWTLILLILFILTVCVYQWLAMVWVILGLLFNVIAIVCKIGTVCIRNPKGIIFEIIAVLPNIIGTIICLSLLIWAIG